MSSSMGFGWHPIYEMENNPAMFQTTKQILYDIIRYYNPLFRHDIAIILPLFWYYTLQ